MRAHERPDERKAFLLQLDFRLEVLFSGLFKTSLTTTFLKFCFSRRLDERESTTLVLGSGDKSD